MKLELQKPYKLKEILEIIYELNEDEIKFIDNLWLFNSDEENDDDLSPESIVYFDKPINISYEKEDVEHEDFFSEFVKENNLWNCYYGEQFIDVLSHYKNNTNGLNIDLLIKGLNYYNNIDDFYEY